MLQNLEEIMQKFVQFWACAKYLHLQHFSDKNIVQPDVWTMIGGAASRPGNHQHVELDAEEDFST